MAAGVRRMLRLHFRGHLLRGHIPHSSLYYLAVTSIAESERRAIGAALSGPTMLTLFMLLDSNVVRLLEERTSLDNLAAFCREIDFA